MDALIANQVSNGHFFQQRREKKLLSQDTNPSLSFSQPNWQLPYCKISALLETFPCMHLHYNLLLAKQTPSSKSHKIELSNFKIPCHTLSSSLFLCLTMANPSLECPLPLRVEEMLKVICSEQNQPPPNTGARRELASLGEGESLKLLEKIRHCKIRSFSAFIHFMAKKSRENVDGLGIDFSPPVYQKLGSPCSRAASPVSICSSSRG